MNQELFSTEALASTGLAQATTIPARWCTDPEVLALEREAVFGPAWQLAGSIQGLDNPGDYRVEQIAGATVILVRGQSGELHAHYNVCRHRAGPVASDAGNCRVLRCKYHGWVYGLDGQLQATPELGDVADFERKDYGLVSLALSEQAPLLLVAGSGRPEIGGQSIDALFTAIRSRVGSLDFSNLKFYRRDSYSMRCNWKVYVDNYLEGYHLPQVHPELTKILDYRDYTTEVHEGYSLQFSEIRNPTEAYGAGEAYYYFLFPNLMLNILPGRLQTNVVIPEGPDRCRVVFDYYYDDISTPEAQAKIEEDIRFGDLVQQQDIDICEQVQLGLASGVYDRGRLSVKREQGVHHFHENLRAAFRAAL